jgi:hypothetical protein
MKAQKLSHLTFIKMKLFLTQNNKVETNLTQRNNLLSKTELLTIRGGYFDDGGGTIILK